MSDEAKIPTEQELDDMIHCAHSDDNWIVLRDLTDAEFKRMCEFYGLGGK